MHRSRTPGRRSCLASLKTWGRQCLLTPHTTLVRRDNCLSQYRMAGRLALVACDPVDVPSHAAVPEDLRHLRDFQRGHLPPLARVRMPEAAVRQASVCRILREGVAVVCHVFTSLAGARRSREHSLPQKEAQKSCHKDLVITFIYIKDPYYKGVGVRPRPLLQAWRLSPRREKPLCALAMRAGAGTWVLF